MNSEIVPLGRTNREHDQEDSLHAVISNTPTTGTTCNATVISRRVSHPRYWNSCFSGRHRRSALLQQIWAPMASEEKPRGAVAKGILDRLSKLESQQETMMADIRRSHQEEMEELRKRLQRANESKRAVVSAEPAPQPVLMSVDMAEIDAAVHAAHCAAERSDRDVQELLKAALDVRKDGGKLAIEAPPGVGGDGEYLVKRVSVNLDDVERVINESELVEVCRAFGRPDNKYGNEVYCAVVPKRNVRVSEPMMMTHAQQYLPTAMVPKRFFFLERLPSGVTRKALADTHEMRELSKQDLRAIEGRMDKKAIEY